MTLPDSRNDIAVWRAPELGAELLRGRFGDFSYDVHTHDTACFALLTEGAIRIRMRGSEFVARAGDLYAIDADEPHAGWPVDARGWRQRTVYVDIDHLRALLDDGHTPPPRAALAGPLIRDAALFRTLYRVHRCSQEHGPVLLREERYLAFAARLVARHLTTGVARRAPGNEERSVRIAREFLDAHLDERVQLGQIAEAAGLPRYRLFRAFARATGMTPHEYQRQARVRKAVALIRHGHALADVAALAGFTDQAHLTRWFRRAMAVTPGVWRNAMRDGAFPSDAGNAADRAG